MVSKKDASTKNFPEYDSSTIPSIISSGLTLFSRRRSRRLLAQVGPQGLDSFLQPSFFSNKITRVNFVNGTAFPSSDGVVSTNGAALTSLGLSSTNFFSSIVRARLSSSTTAQTNNYLKSTNAQWFLSNTPNMGGFHFVAKFGVSVTVNTNRIFVGLSTTAGALSATVEPSTYLNLIGVGCDSTDANLSFMFNDASGNATKVPLGSNFPAQTAGTYIYELSMFAPSGNGSTVYWCIRRLNDGIFAEGSTSTDLPALNTLLCYHCMIGNATTAAAASLDIASVYIENDN